MTMKKNSLKKILRITWAMLLAMAVMTACKDDNNDDDDDTPPVIILDGFYVKGPGTALTDLDAKGMMSVTRNEVTQEERASLYEIYIAVDASAGGFNIVKVDGSTQVTYGPGTDWATITEPGNDEPQVDFQRGVFAEGSTAFTVPTSGLYHIMLDTELEKIAIVPVEHWGVIGAATPGGWTNDTELPLSGSFDLNTMTFDTTDVAMTVADFKFRYSNGWKVELDTTLDIGGGNTGVKVNTNYGGSVAALVPGGDNINHTERGYYTISMEWTLGEGYTASMVKTGDLPVTDYSAVELGLVGDGLVVSGSQHNWDETILVHAPDVNNTVYTWTFDNVEVTTAGSFKIREGQDWSGYSFGYPQVTMAGTGAGDFETNNDGNFIPTVDGTYNIEFVIDASTETYTFTVDPV